MEKNKREVARREYDKLEYDVTVTRNQMQEQLDRLGEVQVQNRNMLPLLSLALTGTVQSILLKSLTASTFVAELAT